MKRPRHMQDENDDDEEWKGGGSSSASSSARPSSPQSPTSSGSRLRRASREVAARTASYASRSQSANPPSAQSGIKKAIPLPCPMDKMGGLPLPDVVRELLKDRSVLRWDAKEGVYEVLHGDNFERRFNDLRKVRSKVKAAGTERPFSRMYNFYVLEHGDKWARTGTKFRPRCAAGEPTPEILAQVKQLEVKRLEKPAAPVLSTVAARSTSRPLPSPSSSATTPTSARAPAASTRLSPTAAPTVLTHPGRSSSFESESNRRTRDVSFRTERNHSPESPHTSSRVISAPAAPRHQPSVPPAVAKGELRGLSRRSHARSADEGSEAAGPVRESLSEQIAKAFRDAGLHHQSSPRPAFRFDPGALGASFHGAASRGNAGRPALEDISLSHGYQEEFVELHKACAHGVAGDYVTHDMESAQAADEARGVCVDIEMARFNNHVEMHPVYHVGSPISSEDASSGFPSPESMLALVGEFSGSPLDLGDPELSVFGEAEGSSRTGTMHRDHAMLLDPFEPEEPWNALHSVMW